MPNTYFELALREFGGSAALRAALVAGTRVETLEPGGEITLGQQLSLIRNLNSLQEPGWALQLGRRFVPATHGAAGFAAVSAPTLAEGLAVVEQFAHVRVPYFRFHSRHDADWFTLQVEERAALTDEERTSLLEMLLFSVQGLVELVLGRPMHEAAIRFVHAPPPYAARYAEFFHGRIRFSASETQFAVPSDWLAYSCPMADTMMFESSLRQLETLARRLESDAYVVARVEQLIAASGHAGLSLAQAARALHLSQRTLIRRLRGEGTTYRDVLDEHRRERARGMLRDPHLDIAEVSHLLGYADLANFGRACRRWFGMTPRSYRRRLLRTQAELPSAPLAVPFRSVPRF